MKVSKLRTNNIKNPLGFHLESLRLSWVTEREGSDEARNQTAAQVLLAEDRNFKQVIHDSGKKEDISSLCYEIVTELKSRTRYYWKVIVWTDNDEVIRSDSAWFETAKQDEKWKAEWITSSLDKDIQPYMRQSFKLPDQDIKKARLYVCGLGIYTFEINGREYRDEHLLPGFHAYDHWIQYQTFDVTDYLNKESNVLGFIVGNGWYKGRFGFDGGYYNLYGDKLNLIAELIVTLENGEEILIRTDETWKNKPSHITFSGIYDGEHVDQNKKIENWSINEQDEDWPSVSYSDLEKEKLHARLSLPIKKMETLAVNEVIETPAGETVLDFGQNITGWVQFKAALPKGQKITLMFGEVLQEGNFYQENLRTAKAEFLYVSDGTEQVVEPRFTFYGFRYVKVEGATDRINPDDFIAHAVYSEMEETGSIETSNEKVNQLFKNALWSQKDNFLDVPTDCPQRDERMGWTGDAQIFASTASFNMYTPAFYKKYLKDLREEQKALEGSVPYIVPMIKPPNDPGFVTGHGSSAWGDAATVLPWSLYQQYGDKAFLKENYPVMKDWVDYITRIDDENGRDRLWKEGFHFGDWLALDGADPDGLMGGTDPYYVASAYYAHSTQLLAKTAKVLGKQKDSHYYQNLAEDIRKAIYQEYFTPNGRVGIPTQTAYVVALYMDLIPEEKKQRVADDLRDLLIKEDVHLTTGFVGTPYLCHVLSENGYDDLAYTLLLNEDYPSWLFAVNMGATTIWERWNSIKEDGLISGTGMNSLNHYAYGSIIDWIYKKVCGINPLEDKPGYERFVIEPKLDHRLRYAKAAFYSPKGKIISGWKITGDSATFTFDFDIPFDTEAVVVLPAALDQIDINGEMIKEEDWSLVKSEETLELVMPAGSYRIVYQAAEPLKPTYSSDSIMRDLLSAEESRKILKEVVPGLFAMTAFREINAHQSIRECADTPIIKQFLTKETLEELDKKLAEL
ncbi:alpha-L-rhamnosidase [Alkalibacterium olivapovliticus]|uniref:alpha-L-rhamnosidase n=1 Tax=Alkalibacterium olivapovliticus TaxID=99907 RepID=A0A2T0VUR9_9LACT|nr:alpha-L-rhamnosidase [Alkalibacterium olivapovliticus]PRY75089.1 alpha-L-rhamnosidase [Alkalibacterium olivapovliticus]